ncbi:MAG: class I tRNA ligase family protein, partial [Alphaproteobacteria bacterium]|nr:class I tRNA ligase family protein [Alphaproteobacteria bacterium]
LWCLNSDYSEDMRIGDEILKRQQDVYRRFRNTLRYLLGVLSDFDPEKRVAHTDMPELERLMLKKLHSLDKLLRSSLKEFNFQIFLSELHNFCSNDLSAFYFDIRKDSVYCDGKDDPKRLACLTVMNELFVCLTHWLAPALSFTAEEAWLAYPLNKGKTSVHLELFPAIPDKWNDEALEKKWDTVQTIRKIITESIEVERAAKTIGSSLECEIHLYSNDLKQVHFMESLDWVEIAIVSKAAVVNAQPPSHANINDDLNIGVVVRKADGVKCDRCWKVSGNVSMVDGEFDGSNLCHRCRALLSK